MELIAPRALMSYPSRFSEEVSNWLFGLFQTKAEQPTEEAIIQKAKSDRESRLS
jgi:hypothetical protein